MENQLTNVIIIGCGYIGYSVAQHYLQQQLPVQSLVKSSASALKLQSSGIRSISQDLAEHFDMSLDTGNSLLFHFAPPPVTGTKDLHTANLLQALENKEKQPARIVYISTTGVYGDCQGRWITEQEPVKPVADRAKRRLDAEQQLITWSKDTGKELVILRVAGIYGPGRLPLKRLQQNLPVIREDEAPYTNRIHSADLVNICIAAMHKGKNREIYHACDGQPSSMTEYFRKVATKAGLPMPPEISLADGKQQLSAGMMSYMVESRRLSNSKTIQELEIVLKHPTLESGLSQC